MAHEGEICFGDPVIDRDTGGLGFEKCREWDQPLDYGIAIGAGSNFRLQAFVTPGTVHVGEPILLTAMLAEAGLPVTGSAVTVRAESPSGSVWNVTLHDDGAHQDAQADDGEYAQPFAYTAEEGSYEFTFRAVGYSRDGEPVMREAVRAKYVEGREPIHPDECKGGGADALRACCTRHSWLLALAIVLLALIALRLWRQG